MAFFGMAKILRIKGLDTNNGENKNIVGVMLILTGHIVWRLVTRQAQGRSPAPMSSCSKLS
jgi:hypothetical protein